MTIFAVIVTYNAMKRDWIEKCLESLRQSSFPVRPVIVDNGSKDQTIEFVASHFPDAVVLPQEKNLGFGQANNQGISYALEHEADYVLLLNQDATLHPDALQLMVDSSDGKSLVSPVHLNGDGTMLDFHFLSMLKENKQNIIETALLRHQVDEVVETAGVCAACWLMPRKLIERVGGFNPLFFHYNEDSNYNHRLNYFGIKTLLVTKAYMNHDRLKVGNENAYWYKRVRRELTLLASNINNGWEGQMKDLLKLWIKCYSSLLPKRKYFVGQLTFELLRLLCTYPRISKSRKAEKKEGMTWLN